ncbi:uncharacterized protein BDZ99DRAFT_463684 [Mytilinidion resinicola]|uniref:HTH psq-type domain-containing protein n=1 Tax=Mytilinidion resinicola TaxID=574789 RepID=A0A6A6YLR7_9PEZI|nr:uncharacterized protein BDZ99DRAFT_463684 [Mytilinidion resinicola]KAF2808807.1 hypothetical protein BDZ99DRAFT_463684 [Mytilinidion resinicola]
MDKIKAAIAELHLQEKTNIKAMADKHGVDRSTLSKRFRGKTGSKADGYNSQQGASSYALNGAKSSLSNSWDYARN